jgi:hypothetical protein
MPAGRPALFMIGHSELLDGELMERWSLHLPYLSFTNSKRYSFTTGNEEAKESISSSNEDKDPIYSTNFV